MTLRNRTFIPLAVLLALAATFPALSGAQEAKLESLEQKASYSIGFNIGTSLSKDQVGVDIEALMKGLRDGVAKANPALTQEEMQQAVTTLRQQVQAKAGADNKAKGEAFLAENAKRPEVKTTASGLQYEVLEEGSGPKPKATNTVTVNYEGTTIEGTVFDSSAQHGQPATFPLNRVIAGWTEGLQLMTVGSKYKFYIPADLAYGANAPPGAAFGPSATLIFEVELLNIED